MEYTILVHQAEEGGFWSEVPALPGCYSQGETIDEAMRNTKEAIESYLIALKEDLVAAPIEEPPGAGFGTIHGFAIHLHPCTHFSKDIDALRRKFTFCGRAYIQEEVASL